MELHPLVLGVLLLNCVSVGKGQFQTNILSTSDGLSSFKSSDGSYFSSSNIDLQPSSEVISSRSHQTDTVFPGLTHSNIRTTEVTLSNQDGISSFQDIRTSSEDVQTSSEDFQTSFQDIQTLSLTQDNSQQSSTPLLEISVSSSTLNPELTTEQQNDASSYISTSNQNIQTFESIASRSTYSEIYASSFETSHQSYVSSYALYTSDSRVYSSSVSNNDGSVSTLHSSMSSDFVQDSSVSIQDSYVSNQYSSVYNQDSSVSNQDSSVSNQDSSVSNQDSSVSNQETYVSYLHSSVSSSLYQDSSLYEESIVSTDVYQDNSESSSLYQENYVSSQSSESSVFNQADSTSSFAFQDGSTSVLDTPQNTVDRTATESSIQSSSSFEVYSQFTEQYTSEHTTDLLTSSLFSDRLSTELRTSSVEYSESASNEYVESSASSYEGVVDSSISSDIRPSESAYIDSVSSRKGTTSVILFTSVVIDSSMSKIDSSTTETQPSFSVESSDLSESIQSASTDAVASSSSFAQVFDSSREGGFISTFLTSPSMTVIPPATYQTVIPSNTVLQSSMQTSQSDLSRYFVSSSVVISVQSDISDIFSSEMYTSTFDYISDGAFERTMTMMSVYDYLSSVSSVTSDSSMIGEIVATDSFSSDIHSSLTFSFLQSKYSDLVSAYTSAIQSSNSYVVTDIYSSTQSPSSYLLTDIYSDTLSPSEMTSTIIVLESQSSSMNLQSETYDLSSMSLQYTSQSQQSFNSDIFSSISRSGNFVQSTLPFLLESSENYESFGTELPMMTSSLVTETQVLDSFIENLTSFRYSSIPSFQTSDTIYTYTLSVTASLPGPPSSNMQTTPQTSSLYQIDSSNIFTDTLVTDTMETDTTVRGSIVTDTLVTDTIVTDSILTDTIVTDTILTDTIVTDTMVTGSLVTDSIVTDTLNLLSSDTMSLVFQDSVTPTPQTSESLSISFSVANIIESSASQSMTMSSMLSDFLYPSESFRSSNLPNPVSSFTQEPQSYSSSEILPWITNIFPSHETHIFNTESVLSQTALPSVVISAVISDDSLGSSDMLPWYTNNFPSHETHIFNTVSDFSDSVLKTIDVTSASPSSSQEIAWITNNFPSHETHIFNTESYISEPILSTREMSYLSASPSSTQDIPWITNNFPSHETHVFNTISDNSNSIFLSALSTYSLQSQSSPVSQSVFSDLSQSVTPSLPVSDSSMVESSMSLLSSSMESMATESSAFVTAFPPSRTTSSFTFLDSVQPSESDILSPGVTAFESASMELNSTILNIIVPTSLIYSQSTEKFNSASEFPTSSLVVIPSFSSRTSLPYFTGFMTSSSMSSELLQSRSISDVTILPTSISIESSSSNSLTTGSDYFTQSFSTLQSRGESSSYIPVPPISVSESQITSVTSVSDLFTPSHTSSSYETGSISFEPPIFGSESLSLSTSLSYVSESNIPSYTPLSSLVTEFSTGYMSPIYTETLSIKTSMYASDSQITDFTPSISSESVTQSVPSIGYVSESTVSDYTTQTSSSFTSEFSYMSVSSVIPFPPIVPSESQTSSAPFQTFSTDIEIISTSLTFESLSTMSELTISASDSVSVPPPQETMSLSSLDVSSSTSPDTSIEYSSISTNMASYSQFVPTQSQSTTVDFQPSTVSSLEPSGLSTPYSDVSSSLLTTNVPGFPDLSTSDLHSSIVESSVSDSSGVISPVTRSSEFSLQTETSTFVPSVVISSEPSISTETVIPTSSSMFLPVSMETSSDQQYSYSSEYSSLSLETSVQSSISMAPSIQSSDSIQTQSTFLPSSNAMETSSMQPSISTSASDQLPIVTMTTIELSSVTIETSFIQPTSRFASETPVLTTSVSQTSDVVSTLLSTVAPSTTESSTMMSTSVLPTMPPATTPSLNTSDAYQDFWVVTVIKVRRSEDVTAEEFKSTIQTRLAATYQDAFTRQEEIDNGTFEPLKKRRKRYATSPDGSMKVQVTDVQRETPTSSNTKVTYLGEKDGQLVPSDTMVETLSLLDDQEVALGLGYVVSTKAEPYVPVPVTPEEDRKLWIIAAVLGPLALVILIWIIACLACRYCCNRKNSSDAEEPHLMKVRRDGNHVESDFGGSDGHPEYPPEHGSRSNGVGGLIKSGKKMSYDVNPERDEESDIYAEVKRPVEAGKIPRKKKHPSPSHQSVGSDSMVYVSEEDRQTTPAKRKGKKSRKIPRRDDDTSSNMETTIQPTYHEPRSKPLPVPRSRHLDTTQEEDEELADQAELERLRNKMRLREQRKRDKLGSTPNRDGYRKAQREIDAVLGSPEKEENLPDVFIHKPKKRTPRKSRDHREGHTNEAYTEDEQEESTSQSGESLDEAKRRMHRLLDDAFSLISSSRSSIGNKVTPMESPKRGSHRPRSGKDRTPDITPRSNGRLPNEERDSLPSEEEKKHTPMFFNPTYSGKGDSGLETWSPYRAADDVALISLPQTQTNLDKTPTQERLQTTTFNESYPSSMRDKYYTSEPAKPIVIRSKDLLSEYPEKDKPSNKQQTVNGIGSGSKSGLPNGDTSYPGMKGYEEIPLHSVSGKYVQRENGDVTHKAPIKSWAGQDEVDIVTSLGPGASPRPFIRSLREELEHLSTNIDNNSDPSSNTGHPKV